MYATALGSGAARNGTASDAREVIDRDEGRWELPPVNSPERKRCKRFGGIKHNKGTHQFTKLMKEPGSTIILQRSQDRSLTIQRCISRLQTCLCYSTE